MTWGSIWVGCPGEGLLGAGPRSAPSRPRRHGAAPAPRPRVCRHPPGPGLGSRVSGRAALGRHPPRPGRESARVDASLWGSGGLPGFGWPVPERGQPAGPRFPEPLRGGVGQSASLFRTRRALPPASAALPPVGGWWSERGDSPPARGRCGVSAVGATCIHHAFGVGLDKSSPPRSHNPCLEAGSGCGRGAAPAPG